MNQSLPTLNWLHDDDGDQMRLAVKSSTKPRAVRLWVAHSDDRDFRPDKWTATPVAANGTGEYVAHVEKPASGHVAFFAEGTYTFGPLEYGLSTQIRQE